MSYWLEVARLAKASSVSISSGYGLGRRSYWMREGSRSTHKAWPGVEWGECSMGPWPGAAVRRYAQPVRISIDICEAKNRNRNFLARRLCPHAVVGS
jgi:hypothetical protein